VDDLLEEAELRLTILAASAGEGHGGGKL